MLFLYLETGRANTYYPAEQKKNMFSICDRNMLNSLNNDYCRKPKIYYTIQHLTTIKHICFESVFTQIKHVNIRYNMTFRYSNPIT